MNIYMQHLEIQALVLWKLFKWLPLIKRWEQNRADMPV